MSKDQGAGIFERALYGMVLFLVLKYGARFGLTADDAPWIAGGGLAFIGGAIGWWRNRPVKLLNRAAESIPKNSELVIAPTANATHAERVEAQDLAFAASDKVVAKI